MILYLVPAVNFPTVTTKVSNGFVFLLTKCCKFITIAEATTTASIVSCGIEPCPDFPFTLIENMSAAAIRAPLSKEILPTGIPCHK